MAVSMRVSSASSFATMRFCSAIDGTGTKNSFTVEAFIEGSEDEELQAVKSIDCSNQYRYSSKTPYLAFSPITLLSKQLGIVSTRFLLVAIAPPIFGNITAP